MNGNLPAVIEKSAKDQGLVLSDVNLIMPTETFGAVLGEFDRVTIETVRVNTSDSREVYEPGGTGKGFALGKVALQAIAQALSIQFEPRLTGIVESTARRSRAKAVGIMRKPNGETIVQTEEKTIDLDVEEDDLREKAEKDSEGGKIVGWEKTSSGKNFPKKEPWRSEADRIAWIEWKVKDGLKQKRKFKDELAMTGAKDRVIRAFLALKQVYTAAELAKPLAFPRVVVDTSKMLNDPRTRQAAIGMLGKATADLYGQTPGTPDTPLEVTVTSEDAIRDDDPENAKNVTPPANDEPDQDVDFGDDLPDSMPVPKPREAALKTLYEYLETDILSTQQAKKLQAVIENPDTPLEGEGGLLYFCDLCKKQEELIARRGRK